MRKVLQEDFQYSLAVLIGLFKITVCLIAERQKRFVSLDTPVGMCVRVRERERWMHFA